MSAAKPFVLGFLTAAAVAAAAGAYAWFQVVAPRGAATEARAAQAEGDARRAGREASDSQQWAETERDRNRNLEERVKELESALATAIEKRARDDAKAGGGHGGGDMGPKPDTSKPEEWDRQRLNQEIESLAAAPDVIDRSARFPLVVRALKARGADGTTLVLQWVAAGFDAPHMTISASLADAMGDPRAVAPILERWRKETDAVCRRAMMRALANLPGDEQVPVLLEGWHDPGAEAQIKRLALHGLALRGHEVARKAAETRTPEAEGGAGAHRRKTAVESLRTCAERGGWKDATLIPVFCNVLLTADGPEQRKLALVALEGYWSKQALPALVQFTADPASPEELAARARKLVEALNFGAPRPEGAGIPERGLAGDDGGVKPAERK